MKHRLLVGLRYVVDYASQQATTPLWYITRIVAMDRELVVVAHHFEDDHTIVGAFTCLCPWIHLCATRVLCYASRNCVR